MKFKITKKETIEKKEEFLFDTGTYYFTLIEDGDNIVYKKIIIKPSEFAKTNNDLIDVEWETVTNLYSDKYGVNYSKVDVEFSLPWHLEKYFLNSPAEKYQKIKKITEEEFYKAKKEVLNKLSK